MTVTTPFGGYQMSKLRWNHENTAGTWKCHHELDVRSRRFVVDLDASHRLTRAQRRLSTTFTFQTPANVADWLQNVNAVVEYQHDRHALKSSGRTNFQWGRYAFGHEHDVDIQPYTAIVATAKVTTPFAGYEQLGVGLNNRRTGNAWRANNEVLMGPVGNATLDGSLNYNGYDFNGMIRVTTPVRHLESIVVNVRNGQQRDNSWASHADLQYAAGKTLSLDSKLSLGAQRMIELEVSTPFEFLRLMKFKSGCSGVWRSLQASAELEHNKLRDKITATMSVDTNNLQRMNGRLTIRTPFEEFSLLTVNARHVQDSQSRRTTTVSWQMNRYQGSLLHDVTGTSWVDFDSRYELEYLNNRKIELTSSLHVEPRIVASATLRSPCEHAREISFSFSQEGPLDNFKITSELSYNSKRITTNMEFALRDDSLRTLFRLTTPFNAVDRVAFDVSLTGRLKRFNLQSSLEFNNHTITKTLEFRLRQNSLTMNGNLATPFRPLRSLTYSLSHNGEWRNFRNNLAVTYNGQEITAGSEFSLAPYRMKLELRTPWRALRSYNFEQTNKPGDSFTGWTNSWSMERNGERLSGRSECDWNGNQLTAHFVWNVPQEHSIRISHTGNSANEFSHNIVVKLPDNQITESLQFSRTADKIELQINTASNIRGFERLQAAFKHELATGGFKTTASVSTPFPAFPRMSTELTYRRTETQLTSQFRAELPFEAVQRLAFSLNHRGNPSDFSSSLTATVNDKTVTSTLTFKNRPRSVESSLNVQTPFDGYERFRASFVFNGEPQRFTASGTVQLPFSGFERFRGELTHNGDWRNFQTSGRVETSIADWRRVSFNVEHSAASWTQIRHQTSVVVPAGTYSVKFTHAGDIPNFRTNVEVKTPLNGYDTFVVGIQYEHADSFKTSITVRTPIQGYENFALSLLKTGEVRNMQLKAELRTPVPQLARTAVTWNHRINRRDIELHGMVETSLSNFQRTAFTFSHSGEASQFRTQLRVSLPFRQVPQIDVTLTHRGASPRDFATALSVDYAGKKIELETTVRMGRVQQAEINYEGSFKLVSPCRYVRNFSIALSHNRQPDRKAGAFKIILNGEEKVCTVIYYASRFHYIKEFSVSCDNLL